MILIIDDFQDGAVALCALLSRLGYPCEWRSSGREGLTYIRAQRPELPLLVLLDHMMPEMTGTEVLREIRTDPRISHTTVIMFSAGFDIESRDEAITLGAVAWLLKGGTGAGGLDEVLNAITHWYEKIGGVKNANDTESKNAGC